MTYSNGALANYETIHAQSDLLMFVPACGICRRRFSQAHHITVPCMVKGPEIPSLAFMIGRAMRFYGAPCLLREGLLASCSTA
jgi:hypothetical protein